MMITINNSIIVKPPRHLRAGGRATLLSLAGHFYFPLGPWSVVRCLVCPVVRCPWSVRLFGRGPLPVVRCLVWPGAVVLLVRGPLPVVRCLVWPGAVVFFVRGQLPVVRCLVWPGSFVLPRVLCRTLSVVLFGRGRLSSSYVVCCPSSVVLFRRGRLSSWSVVRCPLSCLAGLSLICRGFVVFLVRASWSVVSCSAGGRSGSRRLWSVLVIVPVIGCWCLMKVRDQGCNVSHANGSIENGRRLVIPCKPLGVGVSIPWHRPPLAPPAPRSSPRPALVSRPTPPWPPLHKGGKGLIARQYRANHREQTTNDGQRSQGPLTKSQTTPAQQNNGQRTTLLDHGQRKTTDH